VWNAVGQSGERLPTSNFHRRAARGVYINVS
jgi:hypothetical protein